MSVEKKIRVIPATNGGRLFVDEESPIVPKKKRVAAYARVSTGREEQQTSFKSQMEYYTRLILGNPDWEMVDVYADEGISGRSMKKRVRFREMIKDALDGKIDLILVKSVSRFARNVLDSLTIIEQLREKRIPVIFEKEKLNSLQDDKRTNFMLTMYASIAQEESDSLSDSVNWGIQRRNEQGFVRKAKTYGYDVLNHEYVINEKQAEVVRLIYELYLSGLSYRLVSEELKSRGIKSPTGLDRWDESTIEQILRNEKYIGDALLQKTINAPWVQKKRSASADNQQYYVEDDHEPIITDEMFERVKREMEYRKSLRSCTKSGRGGYSSKYPFSSKVYCYQCGCIFRRHGYRLGERYIKTWTCSNHKLNGNVACTQLAIKEDDLIESFIRVANMLIADKDGMVQKITESVQETLAERLSETANDEIRKQIVAKEKQLVRAVKGAVDAEDLIKGEREREQIIAEIEELKRQLRNKQIQTVDLEHTNERLQVIRDLVGEKGKLEEFDGVVFRKMIRRITVEGKELTYDFGCGITITDSIG